MSSTLSKKISAAAVSALIVGGSAPVMVPAEAASQTLNYTCPVLNEPKQFKLTADTTLPDTAVAGSAITGTTSASVVIGDDVRDTMYGFIGARQVKGTATISATAFGSAASLAATIPLTPVPASGELTIPASGPVALTAPTTTGVHEIHAGNFTTQITLVKEDNSEVGPIQLNCTLDAGQNTLIDTVTVTAAPTPPPVVKVDTSTTAKAKYAAATKKATVKVVVKAASGGATGKVAVTLKKGSKKIKTISVNLAAGKAKAVFKKVKAKGKYKVTASYAGSPTTNPSSGMTTFKVG
ncbi:Ig-like domain repeat protein [Nocardioides sp. B-3]|uniref:Ig-like domain repeat protein n=1 Tax=Nocardioides sp. B-3 TaxID=2895565 RepID=UPI0021532D49|nr:DUF6801 domain-containing protein [Nocardioides sp. B-3]UUZ58436.1 hypothetical protein LP418_19940 [Nocardioides sp. B-3]